MIATLNILTERVIRRLSGGDIPIDSPYDPAFVKEEIRDTINEDFKAEILRRRAGDEDDKGAITQFIVSYPDIAVQVEASTERVYAELPSYFLSIKHNKGIHSVSAMKKQLKPMIRIKHPEVVARLPHANLEGQNYGWYSEGMKIYWMRDIKRDKIDKVMIKLLIAASSPSGDDPLPLLPESIARILDIATMRVQNKFTQDRLNDNNPNLRALNEQQK